MLQGIKRLGTHLTRTNKKFRLGGLILRTRIHLKKRQILPTTLDSCKIDIQKTTTRIVRFYVHV